MPSSCAETKTRREKAGARLACLLLALTSRADVFSGNLCNNPETGWFEACMRIRPRKRRYPGLLLCTGHASAEVCTQTEAGPLQEAPDPAERGHASSAHRVYPYIRKRHPHACYNSIHQPLNQAQRLPYHHTVYTFLPFLPSSFPLRIPEEPWQREERGRQKLIIARRFPRCRHNGVYFDEELGVCSEHATALHSDT